MYTYWSSGALRAIIVSATSKGQALSRSPKIRSGHTFAWLRVEDRYYGLSLTMSSSSKSASSGSSSDSEGPAPRKDRRTVNEGSEDESDSSASSNTDSDSDSASDDEGIPVLSHKEQRKQKKKELKRQKPDGDLSEKQKGKQPVKNSAELAPSKLPRRQHSVWIGNLAFKTTPDALRRFFDGVGEITRIHMPMKMASGGPGGGGARKENQG